MSRVQFCWHEIVTIHPTVRIRVSGYSIGEIQLWNVFKYRLKDERVVLSFTMWLLDGDREVAAPWIREHGFFLLS